MLFPTFDFLLFFVPVLLVTWLLVKRPWARVVWLLGASYFFYMGGPKTDPPSTPWYFVGLLAFSTVLDYAAGLAIHRATKDLAHPDPAIVRKAKLVRNLALGISLVGNLGLLGYFKYVGFFVDTFSDIASAVGWDFVAPSLDIALPVGISFYTFQSLSYSIDVWRGRLTPEPSFLKFALFVTFFPQLVAGPIVRADEFLPQLHRKPRLDPERMNEGMFRIFKGLIKKVIFGDFIATQFTDAIFSAPQDYTSVEILVALYAFTLQLYADFSGYSDIAIGVALLLGYRLPENFDRPYQSRNLGEFWRRWHMTLSTWLRDYLFFPLGGSKGSAERTMFNLWLTMFLVGMWHYKTGTSWNFVIYATLHASAMVFNRWNRTRRAPLWRMSGKWPLVLAAVTVGVYALGRYSLDLSILQAQGLALATVVGFVIVAALPMTGGPLNTAIHIALTFHFTVMTRVFFRADTFDAAKTMVQGLLAFDGHGIRPGLVTPGVLAILLFGLVYHFTPKSWIDVVAIREFRRIPGPVLGVLFCLLALVLMKVMESAPKAFIYFQF